MLRLQAKVLIQIERRDVSEIQALFSVQTNELPVERQGRGSRGHTQNGMRFFPDQTRYPAGGENTGGFAVRLNNNFHDVKRLRFLDGELFMTDWRPDSSPSFLHGLTIWPPTGTVTRMMRILGGGRSLVFMGCLLAAASGLLATEPLATGASMVEQDRASYGVFIPPSFGANSGPSGVFVFFGGRGDSVETYMRSLTPLAEAQNWVLIVPQLPWFKEPTKASASDILRGVDKLIGRIEKEMNPGPLWLAVGGASAGGAAAHDLAKKWSSKLNLLVLASTGPFSGVGKVRTLHIVADNEQNRLGSDGRKGNSLGKDAKDIFLIPNGKHSAQIPHFKVWMETEIARLRLAQASATLQQAEAKLRQNQLAEAETLLQSSFRAVETLDFPALGSDAFYEYENQRRAAMKTEFAREIEALAAMKPRLSPGAPPVQP